VAKNKIVYTCVECGAQHPKWMGQCSDCGAWNTLEEGLAARSSRAFGSGGGYAVASASRVVNLDQVGGGAPGRQPIGMDELDRVLGGGLVPGSVSLIAGSPGIGKSTLLLQVLAAVGGQAPSLYVTGEESAEQVADRGRRLGLDCSSLRCLTETNAEAILQRTAEEQPRLLVVDSIQTLFSSELQSAPGSVSQVREAAGRLVRHAKESGCAVVLVGHVTKEGAIAGPRVLEHMVDTVLYFESESDSRFRIIRATKNRFGAVNELGVFAMTDRGLRGVSNPSAMFLSGREASVAGSCVLVTLEGTRPMLLEVQALVDQAAGGYPRRVTVGVDAQRLGMLLAVMHRHAGISLHDQDVYVNVAGGLRVAETASDLAVTLAIRSSLQDRALPADTAAFGELGLSGELRPVPDGDGRVRAAAAQGFKRVLLPSANQRGLKAPAGIELMPVSNLQGAIEGLARL